ncbi:MAG: hypothetical protein ACREJN_08830 [Nitrospiraceae bacterium]
MGFLSSAVDVGRKIVGTAAKSMPNSNSTDDSKGFSGTPLLDKITKWARNRSLNKSDAGANDIQANPNSAKKGALIKKTGIILVHKGERVLTKKQQKTAAKRGPRKSS